MTVPAAAALPEIIPIEILFGNPVKAAPEISPDGKTLAYLAPLDGVLNIWVRTLGREDDRPVTRDKNRGIRRYFWAPDNREILYLQDVGGNENWRLYGVDPATGQVRDLTPFDDVQARIAAVDKHFPGEILIELNKENPQHHDVYRLNLSDGKLELIAKNPGNVASWVVDADMKVRAAVTSREDGGTDLLIRSDEKSPWVKLLTWDIEDSSVSGPSFFSKDGRRLFLKDSKGANTARLVELDLETERARIIAEDPVYDVGGILVHQDTMEIQMVSFVKDRLEYLVLDESIRQEMETLLRFESGDFFIQSRDYDDRLWVVGYNMSDRSAVYYVYDRSTKKTDFLFKTQPMLDRYKLAPMEPVEFESRDGLAIPAYITFPAGVERKNLPLVLNVHGGPWVRDTWGYDSEAQWFANRGYISLQVNYRGSSGYGKKFLNAGNKEWGGKMHDDLVDAVRWAVGQGYADPKRVAVFGGSYGGYAALVGATFTPDVFACAVDIVGPSDLMSFIKSIPPYWAVYLAEFKKRVGDPDTEAEFLRSRSPLFKVDRIRVPMLIAQGANDPRVKQAESEQIVKAMKEKGIDHEYMLFSDEGHGFGKPENRIQFYKAADKFLAKHLNGRAE